MKLLLSFSTMRARLLLWFLVIAAAPLLLLGSLLYRQQTQSLKHEAFTKLEMVRDLKVQQINAWMDEIVIDLEADAADSRDLLAPDGKLALATDAAAQQKARDYLNHHLRFQSSISEISLLDPGTGRIFASTAPELEGEDRSTTPNFTEPLRTKKTFFNNIHFSPITNRRRMNFAVPVLQPGPAATVAAILVADIDLAVFDKLLQERIGMGDTGETLVVNRDIVALSELRWRENAPLRLKLDGIPAILAAQGQTGIIESPDYRGTPVLAAYTHIRRTAWGFVAKQDLAELYKPIAALGWTLLSLLVVCLALAALLAWAVAVTLSRPLGEMRTTAESIRTGNWEARNQTDRSDELGQVAQAFNLMADQIQSQMTVQQGNREIMEAMTRAATLSDFCGALLQVMIRVTRSDLGAFYLPGADGRLAPAAAQGLSAAALEPFDAQRLEGAMGAALASRKVNCLREIPPETRFTFRTVAGTAVPRALLTIPIVVGDRVAGLMALGSLRDYSPESLAVVEISLAALGIGFANRLAGEETRRMAAELLLKNTELEAQTGELTSQTVELQKQTTTLQEQKTELEIQTARVAEASRLKSEFLSNMSHELRTPLNSVLALSRVLLMQGKDRLTPEETSYLEIIERNGKHLLSLINDILDLAKIESGRMEIACEEISLHEKIATVAESLEPLCREKGIALAVHLEADLPHLWSDERRVHQILQNIMGNAVKFTRAGHVTVTAQRRGDDVEVVITDTGIGIPEKEIPRIFDEFRQGDGSTTRSFEGTGLGLAIAAKSIRLLGGRIAVRSRVGVGSTFTVTIPLAGALPATSPADAAQLAPTSAAPLEGARRTVLVVDDNPSDASLIANYLAAEGYETLTALSGKEALRLAEVHRPFAITLDVIMPDQDGWEVLQALKRNPATAPIPVIIVSMADDHKTGLALGAIGVVSKPVDRLALLAEVRRVVPPGRASVLVVDDVASERRLMAAMLEGEGLEVRQASDGPECLARVTERLPDAIALDLTMPGMSGFDVLDALRNDPRTRVLPVIIVTARDLSGEERARLRGRVAAVVEKSRLPSGDLLVEIARILERIGKAPARAATPAAQGRRLLVVEDSEPAIIQIRMTLETAGYRVEVARNGQEALDLMRDPPPDGIILDLMMPQIDGFEVLERLRGTPGTAHLPVLILTAKDLSSEDRQRLSSNHVRQLIQKGDVDRPELLRQVERLLDRAPEDRVPTPVATALEPAPARKRPPAGSLPAILAIEDNADNLATLRAVLKGRCVLREAGDGEEGLRLAFRDCPDLILLDLSLPKLDGLAVVRRLRLAPATRSLPVIALTAHVMPGDREKALEAGCDDYLPKPIDVDRLLAAMARWIGSAEHQPGRISE